MGDERTLSRRTVGRITAAAASAGSVLLGGAFGAFSVDGDDGFDPVGENTPTVDLPPPTTDGTVSVEATIADRRSRRTYTDEPLSKADLGQLLWAAQGITAPHPDGVDFRTAPSAGATYPLEVFVVVGNPGVEGVASGVYHHQRHAHRLEQRRAGDFQGSLQAAGLDQDWIGDAAIDLVVTAIDARTTDRYGRRGRDRYVPMEAGHVGENLYLQAEARDLATVAIGAFRDGAVRDLLGVSEDHRPLYIFPVGNRRGRKRQRRSG